MRIEKPLNVSQKKCNDKIFFLLFRTDKNRKKIYFKTQDLKGFIVFKILCESELKRQFYMVIILAKNFTFVKNLKFFSQVKKQK